MYLDNAGGDHTRKACSKDKTQAAIATVRQLAQQQGISGDEVALRWVQHHRALRPGFGDAMIVAASSAGQLETTLTGLEKGPLPKNVLSATEGAWEEAKGAAPDHTPFMET